MTWQYDFQSRFGWVGFHRGDEDQAAEKEQGEASLGRVSGAIRWVTEAGTNRRVCREEDPVPRL